jgi:hypothetical protein
MKITNKCQKCDTSLVIGENTTSARVKNYDWTCTRCISKHGKNYKKTRYDKLKASSQAGVYGCYLNGELVYVGESQACELRWYAHLYWTQTKSKSSIGLDLSRRHDYDWKILELEENVWRRKVIEIELIVKHKPCLNSPYRNVLAMD